MNFGAILEHFGANVRLIHIVRDGRDAITSRHLRRPNEYYYAADRWVEMVSAGLRFRTHPQVVLVRYEDLVREFSATLNHLCAFLGEPVDRQILDWYRHASVRVHPAWKGAVRPMDDASVGRWQQPEHARHVARFTQNEQAVALLHDLGYMSS